MLGIDWIKILIHFVVFAVLAVGLYLLLYKPIMRFIKNRQDTIQKGLDDGKAMQEEAQATKAEYDRKLADVEAERTAKLSEAEGERQQILADAKAQAAAESAEIRAKATAEAEAAKAQAVVDMQEDAGKVAVTLAGEILQREISQEENEQLILDCLKAWSDHD